MCTIPVISQPRGPTRKRRISPVAGSAASIWLLPMPVQSSVAMLRAAELVESEHASRVDIETVGLSERDIGVAALEWVVVIGIAGLHEDVPDDMHRRRIVIGFAPSDDVAHEVRAARIGGVGPERLLAPERPAAPARGVVRERTEHFLGDRMYRDPFRPIHVARADDVRRGPGIDQHLGLRGEAGLRC